MTYVIALPCVDLKDRGCVEECPVDCIYEGGRSLYIHPDECVDCDAFSDYLDDNARFFTDTLPGQTAPLRSPGGASKLGPLAVNTAMVASLPPQEG